VNLTCDKQEVESVLQISTEGRKTSATHWLSTKRNVGEGKNSIDIENRRAQWEDVEFEYPCNAAFMEDGYLERPVYRYNRSITQSRIDNVEQNNISLSTGYRTKFHPSWESNFEVYSKNSTSMQVKELKPLNSVTALSTREKNKEPLPFSRGKPKTKKKKVLVPLLAPALLVKMEIKNLNNFYNKSNSIVFEIGGKVKDCETYLRETVSIMYSKMMTLSPRLTFMHNSKELKFKGSYWYDYAVCYFDAQVWKLDPTIAKGDNPDKEYIIEFRRRSLTGYIAFEWLVRQAAGWLLQWGRAKKYGNGFNIYPVEETCSDFGDEFICDETVFCSPVPSSVEDMTSDSDSICQIILDNDLICRWAKKISERSTYCEEIIRILAICSKHRENRILMAEEPKLHEALCKDLNNGRNPSSCANTLVILEAILEFHAADSFIKCGMLLAVARCLLLHSGYKHKLNLRSVAIERAALKLLEMLIKHQKLRFAQREIEKVLRMLVKDLEGKLKDEKNNRCLNNVIKGLKKKK